MRVYNRVLAFLFVMCLVVNLAFFPLRARAAAGALTAVGAAVTVSAFLAAYGIYPYISTEGQSFSSWGSSDLYESWKMYYDTLDSPPVNNAAEAFNNIKSFVVDGSLAIAKGTWNLLSDFASWLVSEFTLGDNETGRVIAANHVTPFFELPGLQFDTPLSSADMKQYALCIYEGNSDSRKCYIAANQSGVFIWGILRDGSYSSCDILCFSTVGASSTPYKVCRFTDGSVPATSPSVETSFIRQVTYQGTKYDVYYLSTFVLNLSTGTLKVPLRGYQMSDYGSWDATVDRAELEFLNVVGGGYAQGAGMTVDTGSITPLEALPADTPWGGLAVQGANSANPATVIEQGVIARQKPVVRPVDVEIGQDIQVDAETGDVIQDVITINPDDVIPTVAALSPPVSFLSALQTTMTTKFPFCLPFDLVRIVSAFYVAPQAPVISLTFHDPFTDSDYTITVDLSPWDNVAAVVRNFEAMILLAGFCLNFDKFNIIHLILGGLG